MLEIDMSKIGRLSIAFLVLAALPLGCSEGGKAGGAGGGSSANGGSGRLAVTDSGTEESR